MVDKNPVYSRWTVSKNPAKNWQSTREMTLQFILLLFTWASVEGSVVSVKGWLIRKGNWAKTPRYSWLHKNWTENQVHFHSKIHRNERGPNEAHTMMKLHLPNLVLLYPLLPYFPSCLPHIYLLSLWIDDLFRFWSAQCSMCSLCSVIHFLSSRHGCDTVIASRNLDKLNEVPFSYSFRNHRRSLYNTKTPVLMNIYP